MLQSRSQSFRTRLVVAAAATVVLVQLVGATADIFAGYKKLSAEMDSKGALIVSQTTAAISQPLWDFDQSLVEEIVESLFDVPDVSRVALRNIDGGADFESLVEEESHPGKHRIYSESVVFEDGSTTETLATLEVMISEKGLWSALWQVGYYKIGLLLLTLTCASAGLHVVLGRLSKPLEELRNAVLAIEREELDLSVPGLDRVDEIGALANAIDGLREREAELQLLRRETDEMVRRERKRIRQTLLSTRDAVVLVNEENQVIFNNAPAQMYFDSFALGDRLIERRGSGRSRLDAVRAALMGRQEIDTEIAVEIDGATRHFQVRTGHITDADSSDLGSLFLASDVTEQFVRTEQISYLATHDPLTGLHNRRSMDSVLGQWGADANQIVAIMFIDLDRFKSINDTLGHQLGDDVLKSIADLLGDLSGPDDLVARLGGDEFAVATRGSKAAQRLEHIATKAITRLKAPLELQGQKLHASMSAGIAQINTGDGDTVELIRCADLALYEAKANGCGRCEVFDGALSEARERRRALENNLRAALETDAFFPVYQVQTSILDGTIAGFEALARWTDPVLGPVSPAEFIPIAEKTDLIEPLTRKILIATCEAALEWERMGFSRRIAVNISPKLFNGSVANLVNECLDLTGCPPERLELEITESVLLSDTTNARKEIEQLRAQGLSIALDDFGMGYSSMNYLQRFPVDKIKIDRAFVSQAASSSQTRAIIKAIVQLGHALQMSVTGEGAETEEDRMILSNCGVDAVQGFVDSMPMSKADARQLVDIECSRLRAAV